jgi:SAM-dependent methyltransferase
VPESKRLDLTNEESSGKSAATPWCPIVRNDYSSHIIMKDIVENRSRLHLGHKLRIGTIVLRENGFVWCCCLAAYIIASAVADRFFGMMDSLRRQWGIPGMNSKALNKAIWESWDWGAGGDEWTPSEEWKQSVMKCVLEKHMPAGKRMLEIGPGGGRWTGALIERSADFTAVDISASCVELCRNKFGENEKRRFILGSGSDLKGVADGSIDALWSFDVFVHINQTEVEAYADEFRRIMTPGAVGVIHHGSAGGTHGGWRSNLTHEAMLKLLRDRGFEIDDSFLEWQDAGTTHQAGLYKDVINVFRRA